MKLHYYPETDSLYIDLVDRAGVEAKEVAAGVVLDFDSEGRLVGIDIDHASQVVDLNKLEAEELLSAGWRQGRGGQSPRFVEGRREKAPGCGGGPDPSNP